SALAHEGINLVVQIAKLLLADAQNLGDTGVVAALIASRSRNFVGNGEKGEDFANFTESKSEPLSLVDQKHHVNVLFGVEPIARRRTRRFLEQASAFVKANRLDTGSRSLSQLTNRHSQDTLIG